MTDRHEPGAAGPEPLPDALRWQLRALRTDVEPPGDLWARIEPHLAAPARKRAPQRVMLAAAASLVMAFGAMFAIQGRPVAGSAGREAAALLEGQYRSALRTLPRRPDAVLGATIDELDRSTRQIRSALDHDPDSQLLLEQLRRTYAIRLALHQRAAIG